MIAAEKGSPVSLPELAVFSEHRNFVACFCESDKLLSMWRAYAGNGGGYCLGFRYLHLREIGWPSPKVGERGPLLARVHYGNTPECISSYLAALCGSEPSVEGILSNLSPFFPSMIKHQSFAEEREWRTIILDPPVERLKFRAGSANIRPYVELARLRLGKPVGRLPLVSVTFGPMLRREDRPEEIIQWMLERGGYDGVEVRPSNIPIRL